MYTLSEAWSGVNWANLAAQGAFGTDVYDRSILRLKHRAYYRSGRPVIKIGPNSLRSKPRTEYNYVGDQENPLGNFSVFLEKV